MSKEAYVDFYENHVNSAAGEAIRNKLAAAKSAEEFLELAIEGGKAAGFDFTEDEVREVMRATEAQMAKAVAEASGEELSDEDLEAVAGGISLSSGTLTTVNIKTMPSYNDPGKFQISTVMCPW